MRAYRILYYMIRIIVAIDQQRGIAKHGYQPWHIPEDVVYFNAQTKLYGAQVLMGSTTFKTLSEPLAGRTNYVLTGHHEPIEGTELVHELEEFLSQANEDIWVIGGAKVYQQVIDAGLADELYVTRIAADFGCDQFFPEYEALYDLRDRGEQRQENGFTFTYDVFVKKH